jgi:ATP/maltotriose-dependent transcriptional regulator MalT
MGEPCLLLLEEQQLMSFSAVMLELLGLSRREAEVLFWIAQGKSNKAIAQALDMSSTTAKKHLENIDQKLGVQTRTAAVVCAFERLGMLKQ